MALLSACGAEFKERAGSAIEVYLNNETEVMHRPHPGVTVQTCGDLRVKPAPPG